MELLFEPVILLLGIYLKNPESPIQKNLRTPMFIVALFTIVKCWKQPKFLSVNKWIKISGTFTQWNTMPQKERRNSYLLWSIDGTGEYYAKWNKPVGERQNKLTNKIEPQAWKQGADWKWPEGREGGQSWKEGDGQRTRQRTHMNDPWAWTIVWELTVGVRHGIGRRGKMGKIERTVIEWWQKHDKIK